MKEVNSKGFTVLELLIAMCIFITVIFIGYKIIDKATIAVKDQGNTNKGQMTMNDMNKYITKDLEEATSVELFLDGNKISDTNIEENSESKTLNEAVNELIKPKLENEISNFSYEYVINHTKKEEPRASSKYSVNIKKEYNNIKYSILLTDRNETKIEFTKEDIISEKVLPFIITGKNPYKVDIGYKDKNSTLKKYKFEVTSRLMYVANNGNIVEPPTGEPEDPLPIPPDPEVDDLLEGNTGYVSFEYGRFNKDESYGIAKEQSKGKECPESGDLRVSVGGTDKNNNIKRLAYTLGTKTSHQIPIIAIIDPKDNNGKVWARIDNYGDASGSGSGFHASQTYFGKDNNINALNIVITEGTVLRDFKINGSYYKKDGKEYKDFESGKYILTNQVPFTGEIKVTGTMEKKSESGAVIITFGSAKK